jgi:dipeptidase E
VTGERRRIVALGGGGFLMEPDNPLLDEFVLAQARAPRPRICFVGTASGDAAQVVTAFYRAFARHDCIATDLPLFERGVDDLRAFALAQDVIYVGGGNTASLLAVWRVHGLDRVLAEAWREGVLLCGVSAGMNCWFEQSLTDSFGTRLAPLCDGLGLLPGSACPHYDGEAQRRPVFESLVATGGLTGGWAADDGAALVFAGTELSEVVSSRPGAAGYRVERAADGVRERRIEPRRLGP